MMKNTTLKRSVAAALGFAVLGGGGLVAFSGGADSSLNVTIEKEAAESAIRAFAGRADLQLEDRGASEGSPHDLWGFAGADGSSFQVDGTTGEVLIAHFPTGDSGPGVSLEEAQATARSFAGRYRGVEGLQAPDEPERDEHIDAPATYTFTWRDRIGDAIGPNLVSVVVNAATGEVSSYRARRIPVKVRSTTPEVAREEAIATAVAVARYTPTSRAAQLEVWLDPVDNSQHLVWRVRLNGLRQARPDIPAEKLALPGNVEVIVDAVTGKALLTASG